MFYIIYRAGKNGKFSTGSLGNHSNKHASIDLAKNDKLPMKYQKRILTHLTNGVIDHYLPYSFVEYDFLGGFVAECINIGAEYGKRVTWEAASSIIATNQSWISRKRI